MDLANGDRERIKGPVSITVPRISLQPLYPRAIKTLFVFQSDLELFVVEM